MEEGRIAVSFRYEGIWSILKEKKTFSSWKFSCYLYKEWFPRINKLVVFMINCRLILKV